MPYDPVSGEWTGLGTFTTGEGTGDNETPRARYVDYSGEGVGAPSSLDPSYWQNQYNNIMAAPGGMLAGAAGAGWTPRMANIPTFDQWRQTYTGDADPYEQYLGTYFNMPSNSSGFSRLVGAGLTPGINPNGRTYFDPISETAAELSGNKPAGPSLETETAAKLAIAATIGGGALFGTGLVGAGGAAAATPASTGATGVWGAAPEITAYGAPTAAGGGAIAAPTAAETGSLWAGASGTGIGAPSMVGTEFMTPSLAASAPTTGGFSASMGAPLATGAGALPAWAGGATPAAASASGVPAAAGASSAGGGSFWESIFGGGAGGGSPTIGGDVARTATGLLGFLGSQRASNQIDDASLRAQQLAMDPARSQYPFYQDLLKQIWTDPNYIQNNPAYQAGMADLTARNAGLGQMFSGRRATDVANYAMGKQIDLSNAVRPLAGFGFGPGDSGRLALEGGQASARAGQQSLGDLGYAASPWIRRGADWLANQAFV